MDIISLTWAALMVVFSFSFFCNSYDAIGAYRQKRINFK